ncbi:MAG: ATP-dependent zinc protease [Gammaproteobacteria bacterium]|nr:ATP-dependent zinc protease [Gammaproteobacteria bacterium]
MKSKKIIKPNEMGWREWVSLPELGIPAIKTKVDTGARTSALHTFHIESFRERGKEMVKFYIHPLQKRTDIEIACIAPILDTRIVKDSGGHAEKRHVILTPLRIGEVEWPIEITLTSRDDMLFRMLLGRTAIIDGQFRVDPDQSYVTGKSFITAYKKIIGKRIIS